MSRDPFCVDQPHGCADQTYPCPAGTCVVAERKARSDRARTHVVYRHFDVDGQLLYVGVSSNPGARMKNHSHRASWWHHVVLITLDHFDTREEAEASEARAIQTEAPVFNRLGVAR